MTSTSTPELQLRLPEIYSGKRVWLSGHTGFKGAWLAEWLIDLGAEVRGSWSGRLSSSDEFAARKADEICLEE